MEGSGELEDVSRNVKGRSGGLFGLEGIGFLLGLTFIVRVIGDIVNRAINGRSLGRSLEREVDTVWGRVATAVAYVDQLLGDAPHQDGNLAPPLDKS